LPDGKTWSGQANFLHEVEFHFIPNDTQFGQQQYLHNTGQNGAVAGADIQVENAWDITTGKPEVVIAIIDTGVDIDHPELDFTKGKIFINPGESGSGRETNGIDDDGNGYIDDVNGWDFYSQDNNPRPGLIPEAGPAHGTGTAGIAAAQGNNSQGVAGVAYGCRILPIKISSDGGTNFPSDFNLGRAIRYAADYADVLSSSWGGAAQSDAVNSAIDYATTSGRNAKGAPPFFSSGNAKSWWVYRFPINAASGSYCLSFYFQVGPSGGGGPVALDNISLLAEDEYTYLEPFFPRVTFEGGIIPAGWSVLLGGGATRDWALWDGTVVPGESYIPDKQFHGTPSTWCLRAWQPGSPPPGSWAEFRSPYMTLNGLYWLRFAEFNNIFTPDAVYQVRLLDTQGQVVQTLGSMKQGAYNGNDDRVQYPAIYANSIAIGAITDNDRYPNYSRYWLTLNPAVTGLFCVGPSNEGWNDVTTLDIAGQNGQNGGNVRHYFGGTSSACPCVAGVGALILSKNSELTLQQLKDALKNGCEQVGDETYVDGKALHYGYGRANAYRSFTVIRSQT